MECKLCGSGNSFELFEETFDRHGKVVSTYLCTNCFVLYNPIGHLDNGTEESFEASQAEIVSTFYKIDEADVTAVNSQVATKSSVIEFLVNNFPSLRREVLVDIGTGSGIMAIAAANFFDKVYASDLDISQALTTIKMSGRENIHAVKDFVQIDDTFDVAVLWHTMEHLYDPGAFTKSVKAKLNPGGVMFCQVPFYKSAHIEDCHVWFYNPASVKRMKEIFGFSDHRVYFDVQNGFMTFLLFA
jgi:ubiquinone/menaquinone biosynthesis C-methylase UbiE